MIELSDSHKVGLAFVLAVAVAGWAVNNGVQVLWGSVFVAAEVMLVVLLLFYIVEKRGFLFKVFGRPPNNSE